jgi:dolichol-phosphate mannosyltransferase
MMNVWVCTATYNEDANVRVLIPEVFSVVPEAQLVVVDDASPDGTGQRVDEMARRNPRIHPIHRPGRLGYASAHRQAMGYVLDHGGEAVVTMDADLSHSPAHVPELLRALEGADVAIGSRYVSGAGTRNWPWNRRLLSRTANALARLGLGLKVRDCTSGFRAYRGTVLRGLRLERFRSEGYCFLEELLLACHLAGAKMAEVPITFAERRAGRSKMSLGVIAEGGAMLAKLSCYRVFARDRTSRRLLRDNP